MSMSKTIVSIAVFAMMMVVLFLPSRAAEDTGHPLRFDFGTTPTDAELAYFLSIKPDGTGLPPGRGTYADGRRLYQSQCAACHGTDLKGLPDRMTMPPEMAVMGTDHLIGGRGSFTTTQSVFTIESHWPYATTLWDYLKRTMPLMAPGSLSNDEIYSLVAYILGEANIVPKDQIMDARSLPQVVMPNRDGFVNDPRPELDTQRQ